MISPSDIYLFNYVLIIGEAKEREHKKSETMQHPRYKAANLHTLN